MDKAAIESLKASRPILDVLRELGVDVQRGRFRCPRPENHSHGDRTPSVSVSPDRGSFKCWVCPDVGGDVIDLVRLVKGCGFREALEFLGAPARASGGRAAAAGASARSRASMGRGSDSRPPSVPAPNTTGGPGGPGGTVGTGGFGGTDGPAVEPSGQTVLFAAPAAPGAFPASEPVTQDAVRPANRPPSVPIPPSSPGPDLQELRESVLAFLLKRAAPVSGPVARYLQKRRIFKRTWDGQGLRMIDDYAAVSAAMEAEFGRSSLERSGFFNPSGNLRYYRHRLLFPYFDAAGKAVYAQARAIEDDVKPKELSMAGPIPLPYNARLLDGSPGQIYLCEGVIDTLTLLEQGFPAVGAPGAANFKAAWARLFLNKSVHVAFDPDAPGDNGAARAIGILEAAGVEARRLQPPKGLDLNDWFRKG